MFANYTCNVTTKSGNKYKIKYDIPDENSIDIEKIGQYFLQKFTNDAFVKVEIEDDVEEERIKYLKCDSIECFEVKDLALNFED